MDEFKPGQIAVIKANETQPRHNLKNGTRVEIRSIREPRPGKQERRWNIVTLDDKPVEERFALESDMDLLVSEEDLDAEARRLLGVDETTRCPCCGRAY